MSRNMTLGRGVQRLAAAAGLTLAMVAFGMTGQAGAVVNPCGEYPIDLAKYGGKPFQDAPVIRSENGALRTTLTVGMARNSIGSCEVELRSYNGGLVGPTLRVKPGDTLYITLDNTLPPNPPRESGSGAARGGHGGHGAGAVDLIAINTPHDFNTTNLHTHGLHVSPEGNSDNVFLRVEPQTRQEYVIAIPEDHPPGTFWYHAHVHGSTALQVSSGMAGAIIVEGGLDDVPNIRAAEEQVFLFQQIAYDVYGRIDNYSVFGPNKWAQSHRSTLINGQVAPEIVMAPGEVQRWRMVHGGVRESIQTIVKDTGLTEQEFRFEEMTSEALMAMRARLVQHEIAVDGIALGRMDGWDVVQLEPGYRSDVLVKMPADVPEGRVFLLVDGVVGPEDSLLLEPESERVLARIVVRGPVNDMPLPDAAELAPLLPFAPITPEELDPAGAQTVVFNIAQATCPADGGPCVPCTTGEDCVFRFMINERPYGDGPDRELKLGTAAQWTLSSKVSNHPFHIHVNPFMMTRLGPDNLPQTVWRDTYLVRQSEPPAVMFTRYETFTGRFVIHCHILDHEDQGMMQAVRIVP